MQDRDKTYLLKAILYLVLAKPKGTKGGMTSNPVERFVAPGYDCASLGCANKIDRM